MPLSIVLGRRLAKRGALSSPARTVAVSETSTIWKHGASGVTTRETFNVRHQKNSVDYSPKGKRLSEL